MAKKTEAPVAKAPAKTKGGRKIIRVAGTDLDSESRVEKALTRIKGFGIRTSKILSENLKLKGKKISELNDKEKTSLEGEIKKPRLPQWMLNRRRDIETGEDIHLSSSKLDFAVAGDKNRMKSTRSYKGVRHERGLPVRGQRTRSSFRGGTAVGVNRKATKSEKKQTAESAQQKKQK